jgi:hypothetical protein
MATIPPMSTAQPSRADPEAQQTVTQYAPLAPVADNAIPTPAADSASSSPFITSLNAAEQHWPWKLSLRSILLIILIIGIGSTAYATANAGNTFGSGFEGYDYFFDSYYIPWGLIPLTVSFIWCAIAILVLLLRKRPVHPGAAVGIDLVLWLAFIFSALFATASIYSVSTFGKGGEISDPSGWMSGSYGSKDYDGSYVYVPSNNSWVYNITWVEGGDSSNYVYNSTSGEYVSVDTPLDTSNVTRDCTPAFASCADQDNFINELWHDKGRREGVLITSALMQYLAVLLHFTLFVWACVDTNRRRRQKGLGQAQLIAEKIIEDMQKKGQLTLHAPMTRPLLAPGTPPLRASRSSRGSARREEVAQQPVVASGANGEDVIEKAPARYA